MKKPPLIERLARAYVEHCGDVPAAMRVAYPQIAGDSDRKLTTKFDRNHKNDPLFLNRVIELQKVVEEKIALTAADVLHHMTLIATADVADIVQTVTVVEPCRNCWLYYEGETPPGDGPEPGCTHCKGEGTQRTEVRIKDTKDMTMQERLIYDGAEVTKYGVKIKTRDRDAMLLAIGKALGMFTTKLQVIHNDSPQLPPLPDDPNEASRAYLEWIKKE